MKMPSRSIVSVPELSRRDILRYSAAFAALRSLHAAVKPVRITDVDLFGIHIPVSPAEAEAGVNNRFTVAKVVTDAGVNGYSFAGPPASMLPEVKRLLAGKDLFSIDQHLKSGLGRWGGVEHAIWDAIGRIAGQPAYKLLGGPRDRVKAYLTCVWKGNADQQQVSYKQQVDMAVKIQKAGFKGKKVWDFETGLKVARGFQDAGAYWLEEPFAREDYESPAKLARMVDILITGGEAYTSLEPYRQCLLHQTYDILQPDGSGAGGIFMCRKVSILAESFHVPCILHGSMALMLAGWLQASLAVGAPWQEVALITPPLMPEEQWAPGLK